MTDQADEYLLRTIFETSPDGIITIDSSGLIESVNSAAEHLFGYDVDEMRGRNINILMPEPFQSEHDGYLSRYMKTGEKKIIGIGREVVARRKDGSVFPIELAVGEMDINGEKKFAGFIRDISLRREAEDKLAFSEGKLKELQSEFVHVSRLSAMGEMAATLAHELNQPLAAMMNYAQAGRRMLAADDSENNERLQEIMTKAADQAKRAGEIIRRLRSFVAQGDTERMRDDIGDVVKEACALALVGANSEGVKTVINVSPDLPEILMDRVQIQQVIVNLVRNSLDATREQETRTVSVGTLAGDDNTVIVHVSDNGPGLDPKIAERLFQPFNSSKDDGMGIGLSISRTIVEQHGGRIWTTPNDGEGVTFSFALPVETKD